ncbi:MAG TPA: MFS transporter [Acidimicrobiales bacterium]|nr:MFS transporter [Acidimicrobiales bacterium]
MVTEVGAQRWWALGAVVLAVLAVGMDLTILSVALPTLAGALKASESDLQWFSSGYALVLAAAMLPAGLMGDRYGRKKVMLISLALFALGSLACAYSRTPAQFLAARVVLGLAGAGLVVMAVSALAVLFSEDERPKAVGVWAAANMIAFPIGPILGGWLLTHYWWGWVFLINVPVSVLGLVAVVVLVPESKSALRPGIDTVGIVSSSAGLVCLTYGLIEAGEHGWGSAGALTPIVLGVGVIAGFFAWEHQLEHRPGGQPLVDLSLFRSPSFLWGVILFTVLTLALIGLLFTMPQYFQGVVGTSPEGSGVRLLPVVGGMLLGLLPAARLAKVVGAKLTVAAGFLILAVALGIGSTLVLSSGAGFVAGWMTLGGIGTGLTMATAASAALVELSEERAGVGSGVLQALKNTGAPLGSAILGSVLAATYVRDLHLGGLPPAAAQTVRQSVFAGVAVSRALHSPALLVSVRTSFVHGMDAALLVSMAVALVGCLLSLLFLPAHPRRAAEGQAELPASRSVAA